MAIGERNAAARALVLGGGGVTGIAWEVGILTGLLESGVVLNEADIVIGTSAGAFVGVALASGYDMRALFAAQSEDNSSEIPVEASEQIISAWFNAFMTGGRDPLRVGKAFGDIARQYPASMSVELRKYVAEARLVTADWPGTLRVTAIEADTGALHVFDQTSGVALIDAVTASGAVPGIWPLVSINGRAWVDGGMVSTTNARLAAGHERIVILAPMPTGYGLIPGAVEDVEALRRNASVFLVAPDESSVAVIGPNPYDPARRKVVAAAGRAQGRRIASTIAAMW